MNFSSHEDIEAPIDAVFAAVTDFQAFERQALRRGAEVQRSDSLAQPGPGMTWDAAFMLRGKRREIKIELARMDRPNGVLADARSRNLKAQFEVDLVALSRNRTRLSVTLVLEPKTLAARLMLQSIKLARKRLTRRFRKRVAEFATDVENRNKPATSA
ncbi:MAG: SRPBCC family protein [Roseovarius gahaiensis]